MIANNLHQATDYLFKFTPVSLSTMTMASVVKETPSFSLMSNLSFAIFIILMIISPKAPPAPGRASYPVWS